MKTKRTVLVADDDRHVRAALRLRLEARGYRVVEVADGLGVLQECPRCDPDVLLLDHGMPNGDGRSIARIIRRESAAPIVFLSGHDRDGFRPIVHDLPDVYFLGKPLDDAKLFDLLSALAPVP